MQHVSSCRLVLTSAVSNGICLVARGGTCEGNRGVEAASALLVLTATYGQAVATGGAGLYGLLFSLWRGEKPLS